MTLKLQCQFEQDLLDALAANRWPARADAALCAHVNTCAICSDVLVIAAAFLAERESPDPGAAVPSASAVWWRSQIRAREESARLAARPIALFQAAATLCVAVLSIAAAPAASTWVRKSVTAAGAAEWWSVPRDVSLSWIIGAAAYTTLPLLAVGMWLVLAPVVVYFALDD